MAIANNSNSLSYALAVDLGTGGPKVAIVSSRGEIVSHGFSSVEMIFKDGGGVEQSPEAWWNAIVESSEQAFLNSKVSPSEIEGIGITAQWSGTVPVDASGEALANAVIWMDSRGSGPIRRAANGSPKILGYGMSKILRWLYFTGGAPGLSGKDSLSHILYIKEAEADLYQKTSKFLEPADYLGARMTGKKAASFDSITLHWVTDNRKIDNIRYNNALISMVGLDKNKLPDLVPSNSVLGPLREKEAKELGVPSGIPVVVGTGDVHSAIMGSGAVRDYEAHLYIGTSSWITCHVPKKKTDILRNIATLPACIPGKYLVGDEHETAGACLTFLRDAVLFPNDSLSSFESPSDLWKKLDQLVESTPAGSNGVLFTPWLHGERTPVEDHTIRASFNHLSLSSTRADMVRSVYEGVAYNSKWLFDAVEGFTKRELRPLRFVGGGANSPVWAQIHADVLGVPVSRVADPIHVNVRGAGLLALLSLGKVSLDEIADSVPISTTHYPNKELSSTYLKMYDAFLEFYKRTKSIHRKLGV